MEYTKSHEFFMLMGLINKNIKYTHPKTKLHQGEFMMLGAIHGCTKEAEARGEKASGISVSELCEKIHASKPAASKMLNSLEDKGYIQRTTSSTDRRVINVSLTDLGQSQVNEAIKTIHNIMDKAMNSLGEEDSKQLIVLMKKLSDALSEQIKTDKMEENN